jgi:Uma2 family endonuclease
MSAQLKPTMSYAEYLALERRSQEKHDYLRGEVWAMSGGTPRHAQIASNIIAALKNAIRGKPCGVYSSDLRVRVVETDRSMYPDVTVVCGKREVAIDDEDAVVNPHLIIEVLSDSTESHDRGEKFAHLQHLPSLQEYVLVDQRLERIEVFRRGQGTTWTLLPNVAGSAELKSIDASLDFADVYADPNA